MGRIGYDLMGMNVYLSVFDDNEYWTEFYGDIEEDVFPNITDPRGRAVSIYLFVGANHAVNVLTRRAHIGIIMFIHNNPNILFSKTQNRVEKNIFGSKLAALRICKDLIVVLRYKR